MAKEQRLIFAYLLDGQGGGKKIGWDEINAWTADQGLLWVNLNFTTQRTKQWLARESGLNKLVAEAMFAEESRPRTENAAVIFLPLTFITGLLGINVGGIPGSNYQFAFTWVCLMLLLLGGVMLWVFRNRKWV